VGNAIVLEGANGCHEETGRKAAGQGQVGRLQGIAPDGAGRRHDQHPEREEQTLDEVAGSGASLRGAVQQFQRVQQGRGRRHLVRPRRNPPAGLHRRRLDELDVGAEVKEGETTNDLYAFLTTEPNAEVAAIHPKAMPVILTKPEEVETWMTAPPEETLKLQRPLPDGKLRIVARGAKEDPVMTTTSL